MDETESKRGCKRTTTTFYLNYTIDLYQINNPFRLTQEVVQTHATAMVYAMNYSQAFQAAIVKTTLYYTSDFAKEDILGRIEKTEQKDITAQDDYPVKPIHQMDIFEELMEYVMMELKGQENVCDPARTLSHHSIVNQHQESL